MDWKTRSDQEIMQIATPIMDNLMRAANETSYDDHIRDFVSDAKQGLSKEAFEKQCAAYQAVWGHFTEREPVGIIKKTSQVWIIWRQFCAKSDDQYMASLCLTEQDGTIRINDIALT